MFEVLAGKTHLQLQRLLELVGHGVLDEEWEGLSKATGTIEKGFYS
jgi:hypothetical protein